jgi:hypothetical protein
MKSIMKIIIAFTFLLITQNLFCQELIVAKSTSECDYIDSFDTYILLKQSGVTHEVYKKECMSDDDDLEYLMDIKVNNHEVVLFREYGSTAGNSRLLFYVKGEGDIYLSPLYDDFKEVIALETLDLISPSIHFRFFDKESQQLGFKEVELTKLKLKPFKSVKNVKILNRINLNQ